MASFTRRATLLSVGLVVLLAVSQLAEARHGADDHVRDDNNHHRRNDDSRKRKIFRHITLFQNAPKDATAVRDSLMREWNKLKPQYRCLRWKTSFSAPGDNPPLTYNWGGYFDFNNRQAYEMFRVWLLAQPKFQKTFGAIGSTAVRFNTEFYRKESECI